MKSCYVIPFSVIAMLLSSLNLATASDLVSLRSEYEQSKKKLTTDYDASVQNSVLLYSNALITVETQLKKEGNLEGLLAVRKEKERCSVSGEIPKNPPTDLPQSVLQAQTAHSIRIQQAQKARDKNLAIIAKQYLTQLDTLKKNLTSQDKIEEALQVQAEKKTVETALAQTTAEDADNKAEHTPAPQPNAMPTDSSLMLHFDLTKDPGKETEIEGGKNAKGMITGTTFDEGMFQFNNQSGNEPDPQPDSSHDYIYVKPKARLFPINEFSISVIFKASNNGSLIGTAQNESWQKEWVLRPQSFNWASVAGRSSGAVGRRNDSIAFKTEPHKCYHIVITRSEETVRAYVDGALVSVSKSFPRDPFPIYSYGLMIGCTKADAGQWTRWYAYNGLIADVRIYNKALTDAEVKDLTKSLTQKMKVIQGKTITSRPTPSLPTIKVISFEEFGSSYGEKFSSEANLAANGKATAHPTASDKNVNDVFKGMRDGNQWCTAKSDGWFSAKWDLPVTGRYILVFSRETAPGMDNWGDSSIVQINDGKRLPIKGMTGRKVLIVDLGSDTRISKIRFELKETRYSPGMAGLEIHKSQD